MQIGDQVTATIIGLQTYGAFVELPGGQTGLIHISEVRAGYIDTIYQLLKVGQTVTAQIIDIDEYTGKISLSLRTLQKSTAYSARHHRFTSERHRIGFASLKTTLPTWTEEALAFLKTRQQG